MSLRNQINNSPAVAIIAVVLIIVGIASYFLLRPTTAPLSDQDFFFRLSDEQLVTEHRDTIATGQTYLRALVFSCGQCTPDERFVGYFERYTDDGAEALRQHRTLDEESDPDLMLALTNRIEAGRQIQAADDDGKPTGPWVVANHDQAEAILRLPREKCGSVPRGCMP